MAIANLRSQISNRKLARARRRGMTLIELLVVVGILLAVTAVMVPRLPALMTRSKVREAARAIQLYLSTARNIAMTTGRSCGVMIEPLPAENGCSMSLTQVETPSPYGGDYTGASVLTVSGSNLAPPSSTNSNPFFPCHVGPYTIAPLQFDNWPSVPLYPGDQIQVEYQGFWYTVAGQNSGDIVPGTNIGLNVLDPKTSVIQPIAVGWTWKEGTPPNETTHTVKYYPCILVYLDVSHGEQPIMLTQGAKGPYKIRRWPTKSAAAALQLPSPAVIDLTASGYDDPTGGTANVWPTPPTNCPPTIMFAPDGTVDRTYVQTSTGTYQAAVPTTPIYLLVGLRNQVITDPSDPNISKRNLNDFNSLWVSINPATGLITVADIAALPADPKNVTAGDFAQSRALARQASANGGK